MTTTRYNLFRFLQIQVEHTRGLPYKLFKRRCSNATLSVFYFRACD